MSEIQVGMRLRDRDGSLFTVTELTEKGFKYERDVPIQWAIPTYGQIKGGEHYGVDGECLYEVIDEQANRD